MKQKIDIPNLGNYGFAMPQLEPTFEAEAIFSESESIFEAPTSTFNDIPIERDFGKIFERIILFILIVWAVSALYKFLNKKSPKQRETLIEATDKELAENVQTSPELQQPIATFPNAQFPSYSNVGYMPHGSVYFNQAVNMG